MNQSDMERMRQAYRVLDMQAQTLEATPDRTPEQLLESLVAHAQAAGVAELCARVGMEGATQNVGVHHQSIVGLKEKLMMELLHADIDGTLVHARDCDEGRPECSCGAMQEAEARVIQLVTSGRLTGFPVPHEPLADTTARIMATVNRQKRETVVVKRDSAHKNVLITLEPFND